MTKKLKTGWHKMPDDEYFAYPAVNCSLLKDVHNGGPAWGKAKMDMAETPISKSMSEGKALHYAVFDQKEFEANVIEQVKVTGEGSQAINKEWNEAHSDKIILTPAKFDSIQTRASLLRAYAGPFDDGLCEVTGICDDPKRPLQRKIKVDYISADRSIIWDLKSAASVDEKKFLWQARDLHYDMQASFYEGTAFFVDQPVMPRSFRWIVVKSSDPVEIRVYEASSDDITSGREKHIPALNAWAAAVESGDYRPKVRMLDIRDANNA